MVKTLVILELKHIKYYQLNKEENNMKYLKLLDGLKSNANEFEYIESKPNKIKLLSLKVKKDINLKIEKYFKEPVGSVLKSMLVGEKSAIDSDIKDDFINSGLIHILVLSGLHIGFIVVIFLFVFIRWFLSGSYIKNCFYSFYKISFFY